MLLGLFSVKSSLFSAVELFQPLSNGPLLLPGGPSSPLDFVGGQALILK